MSLNSFCTLNTTLKHLLLCLLSLTLISACGFSGDKGGTGGRTSSNSGSGSNNDGGGDGDVFSIKEKIGVRVERINGEIDDVSTSRISIVNLNYDFTEISSNTIPAYRVRPRESGGYELQFSSSYVERLNQVIKVTFDSRSTPPEILYAPLYKVASDTQSITVNSKSHYLLKKMFDTISDSTELEQLIPCTSTAITCPNQSMAKSNMLKQINVATRDYPIEIDEEATVEQALNRLDEQRDLRQHVETATREISRDISPFSKATRRNFTFGTDGTVRTNLTIPLAYHSVFFGLSFSDMLPEDGNTRNIKVSGLSSKIIPANENSSSNPVYPGFNQTISLLDMRRDVLGSDIPFERTNLEVLQSNAFVLDDNEPLNSITSELTDSFLSTQGALLNARVIQQTIPSNIGWEFSPLFTKNYQVNAYDYPSSTSVNPSTPDYGDAPTWLVSSNYSKAASFRLNTSGSTTTREEQLEDSHIFSWEVHGLETNKEENFSISRMNRKRYGAISYSLKLNDQSDANVMQVIAETAQWDINAGTISITQPSTNHYKTFSLARDDNNFTLGVTTESNLIDDQRAIATLPTQDSNGKSQQGLITFGGQRYGTPQGHATSNGNYMALVFNTKKKSDILDRGQGIILASELVNFNYAFSEEHYQLQGNSFEINPQKNILHNLNGSSLIMSDRAASDPSSVDCHATLSLQRVSVEHTVGSQENTLSDPKESAQTDIPSQSCTVDGSEIQLDFGSVFGENLSLRGFIAQKNESATNKPGNLISFIWKQNSQLGLVFANKEQELSPTFNDE